MNEALGWIGQIADWLGQFIPKWIIVDTTHGAIKFRRGNEITVCGAGIVIWWPALTNVTIYPMARQTNDLSAQTLVTKDGKTVVVSAMITYSVDDLEKLICNTYEPDAAIRDITMTVIHDTLIQYTWEEIHSLQIKKELAKDLKSEAQRELKSYGVKVIKVGLKDLAPARVLKVVQDVNQDVRN